MSESAIKQLLVLKEFGLCKDHQTDLFYPEKGSHKGREAKKICKQCPVQGACLLYAVQNDEMYGIWGGMSETERRRLRVNEGSIRDVKY